MNNSRLPSDLLPLKDEMQLTYQGNSSLNGLIAVQEFMDSVNVFAYRNWLEGTVTEGPIIEKYWIELTAMYTEDYMPDPAAGMRLIKRGCKVKFYKDSIEVSKTTKTDDYDPKMSPQEKRTRKEKVNVWMVTIRIPRKLIDQFMEKTKESIV